MKLKRIMASILCIAMVLSTMSFSVFAAETADVEPAAPVEVDTFDELVEALANGGEIKLTANIDFTTSFTTTKDATIDLNGKTLNIKVGEVNFSGCNVTIKNGTIDVSGVVATADAIFNIGKTEAATLNLNAVNVTGDTYSSAFGVFYIRANSTLNVTGGSVTLSNEQARYADGTTSGGVFKADGASASLNITGATMNLYNVQKVITHATTTIANSNISIKGDAEVSDKMEHGINRSALTVTSSTITMENLVGRGITAENGAVSISGSSTVTITNAQEATIDVRGSQTVTVDGTSTVAVDAEPTITNGTISGVTVNVPPKGNVPYAYTSETTIWGETWSNATKSYVIKVLDANGNVMGTTTLNPELYDFTEKNGNVAPTWHISLDPSTDTDTYWIQEWTTVPSIANQPTKVELWVDGVKVNEGPVQLNGPDSLNKIYAAEVDADGKITGYCTLDTFVSKIGDLTDRRILVLRDVSVSTENIRCVEFISGVEGGVTVTNTDTEHWINFDFVTVGEGVTVNSYNVYSGDSENVIEGTLIANGTYYHSLDAKTTVQNGGKVVVNGSTILRYNETTDAGIYIYGDGDASTVEFDCDYYIGAYSGTFYAEDATIETGYFLLKNSYDDSDYADINMTLDNSSLTVVGTTDTQDSFIIDDQASLTLQNGASIKDVRDFSILAGTNLTLSIDESSSISATNVSVADDVPFEAVQNADGTYGVAEAVVTELSGTGTETDPYLINNLLELKWFRDDVNAGNDYSGKYVKLTADIDLNNEEWTPIGYMGKTFKGTFDGGNKTIKNLVITKELENTAANNGIGFFGRTDSPAVIMNLTIENVDITGSLYVGAVVGLGYTGKKVENVTVKGDIAIDAWWYAGVIGGNGYMNLVNNCHVTGNNGSYIKGNDGSYIGGIWGYRGEGANSITNCTVTNLDITGVDRVGGIAGIGHYGNTVSGCTADDVTVTATDSEATTVGLVVGATQGNDSSPTVITGNDVENVTAQISNGDGTYTKVTNLYGTNIDGEIPTTNYVAKIGSAYYETLAAALEEAKDGETVELIAGENQVVAMNGAVYGGKTVTITGTAKADWSKGWLYVGRGGEGDGMLIFDNAHLTAAANGGRDVGIHVSGATSDSTKNNGVLKIIGGSNIELDWLVNRNEVIIDGNSTLTVVAGLNTHGRNAEEAKSGEAQTATLTVEKGSTLNQSKYNAIIGNESYGILNIEGTVNVPDMTVNPNGTVNINGGTLVVGGTLKTNKNLFISGESTVKVENLDGRATVMADTTLTDSYIKSATNGTTRVLGNLTLKGGFATGYFMTAGSNTDTSGYSGTITIEDDATVDVSYGVEFNGDVTLNGGTIKLSGGNASGGFWGFIFQSGAPTINSDIVVESNGDTAPIHFTNVNATVNGSISQSNSGGEPIYIGEASTVTFGDDAVVTTDCSVHVTGTLKSTGDVNGKITKASDTAVIEISGGTYTQDVSEWCTTGYVCEANGDGTYGVDVEATLTTPVNFTKTKITTEEGKDAYKVSFLAGIDSLSYNRVGFVFTYGDADGNECDQVEVDSKKVYTSFTAAGTKYLPTDKEWFGEGSKYIFAITAKLPDSDVMVKARAFAEKHDGTIVYSGLYGLKLKIIGG